MKPSKSAIAQSFSKAAQSYDQSAALQRRIGHHLLDGIHIKQGVQTIADLGCGTGYFTQALKQLFPCAHLYGVDLAEGMLQQAKISVPDVNWVAADAELLPFHHNSIDLLFSNLALQWCHDFSQVLAEAHRVLKPNGLFAFTTLCDGTLKELKSSWQQVDSYTHVNQFMAFDEYVRLIKNSGFTLSSYRYQSECAYYPTLNALMGDLKGIGAHNINPDRSKGLTSRHQLTHLIKAYEHYRTEQGLPSTYQVFYGYLIKR